MPTILFFIGVILCTVSFIWQEVDNSLPIQKGKIVACFKDADWNQHSFVSQGVKLTDSKDRHTFYGSDTIDDAIKKLNAYLDTLEGK